MQGVPSALAPEIAAREAVKLAVDDWGETLQGVLVTIAPGPQQAADVACFLAATLSIEPHKVWAEL